MGSALLNTEAPDAIFAPAESTAAGTDAAATASSAALRRQASERLAAHRNRRGTAPSRTTPEPARPANTRSARIAAAVAERYAHTQSYRAFLAAEAERAVQQARAAAEIAALNAQAVAAAQQSMLHSFDQATLEQQALDHDSVRENSAASEPHPESESQGPVELALWPDLDTESVPRPRHQSRPHRAPAGPRPPKLENHTLQPAPLTVRFYDDAAAATHFDLENPHHTAPPTTRPSRNPDRNDPEARALDEEIAFRHAPVFEEPAGPAMPLPANLIEFPRQLVASRKARPRLAEGPLRDDAGDAPVAGQLRIFEVDAAQISTTPAADPAVDVEAADPAPQWTSIWLDAAADSTPAPDAATLLEARAAGKPAALTAPLPHVAGIGRRMLAATINGAIVLAALFACAAVFVMVAGHVLPWQSAGPQSPATIHATLSAALAQVRAGTGIQLSHLPAAIAVAGALLLLLYQALFFCFSTATPGMLCTRIALCTFDDENPTRKAMRRRIFAVLLSACPLGLGFLWAALDEERLGWHDRITRMYQRSY